MRARLPAFGHARLKPQAALADALFAAGTSNAAHLARSDAKRVAVRIGRRGVGGRDADRSDWPLRQGRRRRDGRGDGIGRSCGKTLFFCRQIMDARFDVRIALQVVQSPKMLGPKHPTFSLLRRLRAAILLQPVTLLESQIALGACPHARTTPKNRQGDAEQMFDSHGCRLSLVGFFRQAPA